MDRGVIRHSAAVAEHLAGSVHFPVMHAYEIRLLDPAGMVVEIHTGAGRRACARTRARILLETHREMSGAEIREGDSVLEVACTTGL